MVGATRVCCCDELLTDGEVGLAFDAVWRCDLGLKPETGGSVEYK